jgi:hypothetical protein
MTSESALAFRFSNGVGVEEVAEMFMKSNGYFNVSVVWVRNHFRWIVWKIGENFIFSDIFILILNSRLVSHL